MYILSEEICRPPFDVSTFHIIISNGVLHHTPNTYRTFIEVAKLVKPGGRLYLWLYRKPEKFFMRNCLYPALDIARRVVSRIARGPQALSVKAYVFALMMLHKILRKHRERSWPERVVVAYDALTPVWRHYHTPLEVSYWFFMNGFSCPAITHWDNPYGFGMVATKQPQKETPGMNVGKKGSVKRYWQ